MLISGDLIRHYLKWVAGFLAFLVILLAGQLTQASLQVEEESTGAGNTTDRALLEVYDESLPKEARWEGKTPEEIVRDAGGFAGEHWAYMRTRDERISISGLSVRICENPMPGEYRYLSFAWQKWGGGQLALEINRDAATNSERRRGELYGYRFDAGEGPAVDGQALRLSDVEPQRWTDATCQETSSSEK